MADRKLTDIEKAAFAVGLSLGTHSPGDGLTRYRFFRPGVDGDAFGVWASYDSAPGVYTALGRADALSFLEGVKVGRAMVGPDATVNEDDEIVAAIRSRVFDGKDHGGFVEAMALRDYGAALLRADSRNRARLAALIAYREQKLPGAIFGATTPPGAAPWGGR